MRYSYSILNIIEQLLNNIKSNTSNWTIIITQQRNSRIEFPNVYMFLLAACCRRCETSKSARCRACNYRFPFNFNGVRRTSAHPCHSSATPGLAHCYGYIIISADWGLEVGGGLWMCWRQRRRLTDKHTHTHTPSILCAACDKGRAPVTRAFHSCMHVAQPPPTHTIAHARTHTPPTPRKSRYNYQFHNYASRAALLRSLCTLTHNMLLYVRHEL